MGGGGGGRNLLLLRRRAAWQRGCALPLGQGRGGGGGGKELASQATNLPVTQASLPRVAFKSGFCLLLKGHIRLKRKDQFIGKTNTEALKVDHCTYW